MRQEYAYRIVFIKHGTIDDVVAERYVIAPDSESAAHIAEFHLHDVLPLSHVKSVERIGKAINKMPHPMSTDFGQNCASTRYGATPDEGVND